MNSVSTEYGEELLLHQEEERLRSESQGPLPPWENLAESELEEHRREEVEATYLEGEEHAAHAAGRECERCNKIIAAGDDARLRPDGRWVHDVCL